MCKKYPAFYSWVQCAHSWSNTMWQKTYLINYSRGLRWKVKFSITHLFPKSSTTFFLSNRFYVCNWGSELMEFQGFCQMNWFIDSFQNLSIYSPKKEFHGFNCSQIFIPSSLFLLNLGNNRYLTLRYLCTAKTWDGKIYHN